MANLDALLRIKTDVQGANQIVALNRGLQGVERTAAGASVAMRGMAGSSALLTSSLGALLPLMSAAGLVGLVKGAIDAGDAMNDLSQRTGVSVEALAKFKKAAATSGTDIDNVAKSLGRLSKGMFEAATTGKGKAADALNALGISAKDAAGNIKSADAVTLEIANRFKAMPDGVTKTALAMALFGKSGDQMIPMLNMGGAAIDSLSVKMTKAFAEKADEYKDKLAILSGKVSALGMDLTIALLPALSAVTDAVTAAVAGFNSLPPGLQQATVAAAALAIAWGPLTSAVKLGGVAIKSAGAAMEIMRYQAALAGGVMPMLAGGLDAVKVAILGIPGWGWALAGVAALTALTAYVYKTNDAFRDFVGNLGDVISGDFKNAMEAMGNFAAGAGQFIRGTWSKLVSFAQSVGSGIAQAFAGPFGVIANIARSAMGTVAGAISNMVNAIPKPIRDKLGMAVGNAATGALFGPIGSYAIGAIGRATSMGPRAGGAQGGGGGGIPAPAQAALNLSGYGAGSGGGGAGRGGKADKPSQAEINARALLATIQYAEGTLGPRAYGTHFGGSYTPPGGAHPDRVIRAGGYASAAYGAYQFMPDTWRGVGGGSMTPARQDAGALQLIRKRGVDPGQPLTREMIDKLAPVWASFPTIKTGTSYYGQGGKSFSQLQAFYRQQIAKGGGDVGGLDLAIGKDEAQAREDADRKKKEQDENNAKQLAAARETLFTKQAQLKIEEAISPTTKLSAEYDKEKSDRMRDYAARLADAGTEQARQALVAAQVVDIRRAEIGYQEKLRDITAQRIGQEREGADALAESMARLEEFTSRSSAGMGFKQGIQGYVDEIGNMRDAVGQLTTKSIGSLEDSLTELATTGTANFKAFAASVLQETSRMIIRQVVLGTIMQAIGGILTPSQGGYGFASPRSLGSYAGGGYTGNGARSGGLDGQGGFMAMLHPRETVIDHTRGTPRTGTASSNNITINVDASGTKASGDPGAGAALARDLARVVDDRLIHHRRPGGLLAA
jgi:lambda family phage tail tape measure protein